MTKPMTAAQRAAKEARRRRNRKAWASSPLNANGLGKLRGKAAPLPASEVLPKSGLADLIQIMRDETIPLRQRITAGIAASRVEHLVAAGEAEPETIMFLRWITGDEQLSPQFRRESAQALAYWERRCHKAALQYAVPDADERMAKWRRVLNGLIRHHLWLHGRWPADKHILIGPDDPFETPPGDPDRMLAAILFPANRHARRKRAIDDPGGLPIISSETEQRQLVEQAAEALRQRLSQFGLT